MWKLHVAQYCKLGSENSRVLSRARRQGQSCVIVTMHLANATLAGKLRDYGFTCHDDMQLAAAILHNALRLLSAH